MVLGRCGNKRGKQTLSCSPCPGTVPWGCSSPSAPTPSGAAPVLIRGCRHRDGMPRGWAARGQAWDGGKASKRVARGSAQLCSSSPLPQVKVQTDPSAQEPKRGGHRGAQPQGTLPCLGRAAAPQGGTSPALPETGASGIANGEASLERARAGGSFSPDSLSPGVSPPGMASDSRQDTHSPPSATTL